MILYLSSLAFTGMFSPKPWLAIIRNEIESDRLLESISDLENSFVSIYGIPHLGYSLDALFHPVIHQYYAHFSE